jgi:hypothetical protein
MCVDNQSNPASLELGKVYRELKPSDRVPRGYKRVIDESGEDYLFPARMFVPVEVPARGRRVLNAV